MNWQKWMMAPGDSRYGLWYYPCINRFVDEDEHILHDLSDIFDVWKLEEWKRTKEYGILLDRNGEWCELYYPTLEEDRKFFEELKVKIESKQLDKVYREKALC